MIDEIVIMITTMKKTTKTQTMMPTILMTTTMTMVTTTMMKIRWWVYDDSFQDSITGFREGAVGTAADHYITLYIEQFTRHFELHAQIAFLANLSSCFRAFAFSSIPGTNLFLLATEASCSCPDPQPISVNSLVPVYVSFTQGFARVYATTPDVEYNK